MSNNSVNSGEQQAIHRQSLISSLLTLGQTASTETALFHQTAAAKLSLGITDLKTLSILLQEGAMTAGQIANRLSLTTGAVTNVIDRLEQRGMVQRQPDTHDRRKVIVVLNPKKLATTNKVYRSMGESFDKLLNTYSTEELAFLVQFYEQSIELTRQEIAKLKRI